MNTFRALNVWWGTFKVALWFYYLPDRVHSATVAEPAVLLRREGLPEKADVSVQTRQINAHSRFERREEAAWSETVDWLRAHGATVNENLVGRSYVGKDGVPTRGVFFKDAKLSSGETLLRVPRHLWLHMNTFPRISKAARNIKHLFPSTDEFDEFLLSINVAYEMAKGPSSFFHPYLKGLPDIEEYRAYLPMFASEEILESFADLPIVSILRKQQEVRTIHKRAFESWQRLSHHPIEIDALSWNEVELALMRVQTRRHSVIDKEGNVAYALVPACDWLNTAGANAINTFWDNSKHDELSLVAARDISSGNELHAPYCSKCHNAHLVSVWGIYMNGNPYSLGGPKDVDCDKREWYRGSDNSRPSLKQTTEEVLELHQTKLDRGFPVVDIPKAPRCKQPSAEKMTQQWLDTQGPIRCSLARLAWEHCAQSWDKPINPGKETAAAKLPSGISTANAEVEYLNDALETEENTRVGNTVVATDPMPASSVQRPVRARMPAGMADALAAAATRH